MNSKFRAEFKTDVANDYFDRSKDPGTFKLFVNGIESEDAAINLWNGYAYLNVLLGNSKVDDLIHYRSEVNDVSRAQPIVEEFYVKVNDPMTKTNSTNGVRKPPSSNQPGNESKKPDGFALPNIIEVSKDNWTQQDFNENSALKVKDSGEAGYDFFVNIDNIHLLSELKSAKSSEMKAIQAKYKFGLVLIGLALLNDNTKDIKTEDGEEGENIFSKIEKLSRAISPVIIPMIETLGALNSEDLVSAAQEEG